MKSFQHNLILTIICISLLGGLQIMAQDSTHRIPSTDSIIYKSKLQKDTVVPKKNIDTARKRSPATKAAIRSAIIPGLGQVYNKKYWKVPLVYGAIAIPVVTFTYNLKWYKKTKYAYSIKYYNDSANFSNIDPKLQPLSAESLKTYRNDFRKNLDYSVLAFLVIWGLQVADAAVDAHLKDFNISDDLSLKLKPWIPASCNAAGLSLVLNIGKTQPKTIPPLR
jgi:hypothetical protein